MVKTLHISELPPAIFAVTMLGIETAGLVFPHKVRSAFLGLMGGKDENTYSLLKLNPREIIWSIRFAGALGILLGAFVLWALWRAS